MSVPMLPYGAPVCKRYRGYFTLRPFRLTYETYNRSSNIWQYPQPSGLQPSLAMTGHESLLILLDNQNDSWYINHIICIPDHHTNRRSIVLIYNSPVDGAGQPLSKTLFLGDVVSALCCEQVYIAQQGVHTDVRLMFKTSGNVTVPPL
jgi:hypothetical protein